MPNLGEKIRDKVPVGIAGPAYASTSRNVNAQTTINWYPELDTVDGKSQITLLPTYGTTSTTAQPGGGPIRGTIVHDGKMYIVSADELYSMDTTEAFTLEGTLNTNSGRVSMASNGTQGDQLMIVDGTDGWIYDSNADTFTQIGDGDFPANPETVSFMDTYFIVTLTNSSRFFISNSNDGTAWTATDFANAERSPDDLVNSMPNARELWLIGEFTSEVWYNSGASFTFDPYPNGYIEKGTPAQFSVAKVNNSVIWLTQDEHGKAQVVMTNGLQVNVISNDAIDSTFDGYAAISDAFGFTYQQAGHTFYQITFPTEDATWVCDLGLALKDKNIAWHQRRTGATSATKRHVANTYTYFNQKHYVGDSKGSNIYFLDSTKFTDDGTNIIRERTGTHIHANRNRLRFYKFEVEIEAGVGNTSDPGKDPSLALSWSNDNLPFGNARQMSLGKKGQYATRLIEHHLGSARDRVFKIVSGDPVNVVLINAYATVEESAH